MNKQLAKKEQLMKTIMVKKNPDMTNEAKLKKIKRLLSSYYKAEDKYGYRNDDRYNYQYAVRAMKLIRKIFLEVSGKLER